MSGSCHREASISIHKLQHRSIGREHEVEQAAPTVAFATDESVPVQSGATK